jgi:hypothetical protein
MEDYEFLAILEKRIPETFDSSLRWKEHDMIAGFVGFKVSKTACLSTQLLRTNVPRLTQNLRIYKNSTKC